MASDGDARDRALHTHGTTRHEHCSSGQFLDTPGTV